MIVLYRGRHVPAPGPTMSSDNPPNPRRQRSALRWQSQAVLLAFVPVPAVWILFRAQQAWFFHDGVLLLAASISIAFAALVFSLRAATLGAALTGGLFTAALYWGTPGWHTALWPLLALFLLTYASTRFRRRRKESLGIAEARHGRTACQVAANLGVATLAGIPLTAAQVLSPVPAPSRAALVAMIAAMAEATADTLSSELGQVLGGEPRLITTLRRVAIGTDGAVSVAGTLAGCLGAAIVCAIALAAGLMARCDAVLALVAAVAGLFVDSLLGAVPERRGWLNNDAVNALSTLAAGLLGAWGARFV